MSGFREREVSIARRFLEFCGLENLTRERLFLQRAFSPLLLGKNMVLLGPYERGSLQTPLIGSV
jgi:hypothetical protein